MTVQIPVGTACGEAPLLKLAEGHTQGQVFSVWLSESGNLVFSLKGATLCVRMTELLHSLNNLSLPAAIPEPQRGEIISRTEAEHG